MSDEMNNMNSNYQNPEMQKDSAGCMGAQLHKSVAYFCSIGLYFLV